MKNYKQLCIKQRYQIQFLFDFGLSQVDIAKQIGVHKGTISRELKRNIPKRGQTARRYIGDHEQGKTDSRHSNKSKRVLLTKHLKRRIEGLMKYEKWSPELIAKRLSKESEQCASLETIYKMMLECVRS
jgi:IS30 family transposase